ncbi:MAG TPA: hypothetical protein VIF15_05850, partial [Polyangiaceae bacterium]
MGYGKAARGVVVAFAMMAAACSGKVAEGPADGGDGGSSSGSSSGAGGSGSGSGGTAFDGSISPADASR